MCQPWIFFSTINKYTRDTGLMEIFNEFFSKKIGNSFYGRRIHVTQRHHHGVSHNFQRILY